MCCDPGLVLNSFLRFLLDNSQVQQHPKRGKTKFTRLCRASTPNSRTPCNSMSMAFITQPLMRNSEGRSLSLQGRSEHTPVTRTASPLHSTHNFDAQIMSSGQALSPLPVRHLHSAGPRVALQTACKVSSQKLQRVHPWGLGLDQTPRSSSALFCSRFASPSSPSTLCGRVPWKVAEGRHDFNRSTSMQCIKIAQTLNV